jgi:hypothetical protein
MELLMGWDAMLLSELLLERKGSGPCRAVSAHGIAVGIDAKRCCVWNYLQLVLGPCTREKQGGPMQLACMEGIGPLREHCMGLIPNPRPSNVIKRATLVNFLVLSVNRDIASISNGLNGKNAQNTSTTNSWK